MVRYGRHAGEPGLGGARVVGTGRSVFAIGGRQAQVADDVEAFAERLQRLQRLRKLEAAAVRGGVQYFITAPCAM